jgi:tRNA(Ile)-lysidine synthase
MGPHPAVAATRLAVRGALAGRPRDELVLAACSGGADSLALAAALAFEAPRLGLRAGGVTVDHGLQPGSAEQAAAVTRTLEGMGLDPVLSVTAVVPGRGSKPGPGRAMAPNAGGAGYPGPEAAARAGRYAALDEAAAATGATAVLLGHTSDDQAECVLLGLARGSGARSLSGMAPRSGRYLRPLLAVSRAQTSAACAALALQPWQDPHNSDPAYARARVRHQLLPACEAALGPGIAAALARTARALRADADLLDSLAKTELERMTDGDSALLAGPVAVLPEAIRTRVLRLAAIAAGCPPGSLTSQHIARLDELVTRWRGQRWTDLPGGIRGQRRYDKLAFTAVAGPGAGPQPGQDGAAAVDAGIGQHREARVDATDMGADLEEVLIDSECLQRRIGELAAQIDQDYAGRELLLVGVLKGAVMVMADLARALRLPVEMDWMAVSSYGSGTRSSGVVRILKDLDADISDRHVLVVEDIVDSGLTLSWLVQNLASRGPASLQVCVLLRKPTAAQNDIEVAYTGFDIEEKFVIGYGLDYAERYRNLPFIGTLAPHVYGGNTIRDETRSAG